MKLSISTLGCPDWDFMQVVRKYAALGADIEVRGIDGETEAGKIARFAPENAEETRRILKEYNLKIVGFGTSCKFDREEKLEENIAAAKEAVDVCARMGIPTVRVFGNDIPEPSRTLETALLLCRGLEEVCAYGAEKGVKVNLEIHGDFNTIESVTPVVERMGGVPAFGILWDVMHSDRAYGDDFLPFYELIRPYIHHVHIKDYRRNPAPGQNRLCLMGQGDVPVPEIVARLRADGYDGYYSFEWEKKWAPEIEEPEVAFPDYMHYMKELLK